MTILSRFWKRAQPGATSPELDDGERVWSAPDQQLAEVSGSKWYNNEWWYEIALDDGTKNVLPEHELARVVSGYALVTDDGYMKGFTEYAGGTSQGYWGDQVRPGDEIVIILDVPEGFVDQYDSNGYNDGYEAWKDFQTFDNGTHYTFDQEDVWGLPDLSEGDQVLHGGRIYTVDDAMYNEGYEHWEYDISLNDLYASEDEVQNWGGVDEDDLELIDEAAMPKFESGHHVKITHPINYSEPEGVGATGVIDHVYHNGDQWEYIVILSSDSIDGWKSGDHLEVAEPYLQPVDERQPQQPQQQPQQQLIPVGQRVNVVVPGRQTQQAIVIGHHAVDEDGTPWYEIQYGNGSTETIDGDSLQVEQARQQFSPEDQRRQDFHPSLQDLMSHIKDTGTPYFPPTPEGQKAFEQYLTQQHNDFIRTLQQDMNAKAKKIGKVRAEILRRGILNRLYTEAMKAHAVS